MPKVVDAALRLIFIERHDGNKKVIAAVDVLNAIDRIANTKIIITEARSKWTSVIEVDESDLGDTTVHE